MIVCFLTSLFFLAEVSKKKKEVGSKKIKKKATNKKKVSQAAIVDYSNVNCVAKMLQVTALKKSRRS